MYYIGIDIGGTNLKAGIIDKDGNIIKKGSTKTSEANTLITDLAALCSELLEESNLSLSDIRAAGIGIPGMVDDKNGLVIYSNNLVMKNLSIVKELNKHMNIPIYIANDADVAALGEARFGSGKGKKNILFLTLGTGVGTGIIINGELLAGSEGGHIAIEQDGIVCTCGRVGCWECYASASALKRMTVETAKENPDSLIAKVIADSDVSAKTAFECARRDDPVAIALVDKYLEYVATGITSLSNVFLPECVLIGGGVSNEQPHYFQMVEEKVNKSIYGFAYRNKIPVMPAALKNDAGILGAAALAILREN